MPPFKILALGDSVVWGQGLQTQHKWVELVRQSIAQKHPGATLASLAHSGAIIDLQTQEQTDHTTFLFGELPRSLPAILTQVQVAAGANGFASYLQPHAVDPDFWKITKADLARQVEGFKESPPDLILLDGGINDLGALQIVLPWSLHDGDGGVGAADTSLSRILNAATVAGGVLDPKALPNLHILTPDEFRDLVNKFVFTRMTTLLAQVAAVPTFRDSKVIVTGYFPIFTAGSIEGLAARELNPAVLAILMGKPRTREELLASLRWALSPMPGMEDYHNFVIQRSDLWYKFSTQRLQDAVDQANARFGNRFALASPEFGRDNGAFASDSLLWTFTPAVDSFLQDLLSLLGGGGILDEIERTVPILGSRASGFSLGYLLGKGLAEDEVKDDRSIAASQYYVDSEVGSSDQNATLPNGFTTSVASAGHPNVKGAQVYARAVEQQISQLF